MGSTPVLMGAVFVLALAVRILYVLAYRQSPFFDNLMVDAQWHDEWAWRWATGSWDAGEKAFFRAPLYPLWLSAVYAVFGHSLLAVRLVQAVLGAMTAAALAGAGLRWAGRKTGWAVGLLAAGYGPLIFFDGELLIPNLLLALLAWALFILAGAPSLRGVTAAGLLLGLAVVARPNVLFLLPAAVLWVWRRAETRAGKLGWTALLIALGLAPALGVSAVNRAREGTWVFVASQGGVNFYAGNHPTASGRSVEIPELANILTWRHFVEQAETVAEEGAGRPLDSREVSEWWFRRGVKWIVSDPMAALSLYARKLYFLINANEIPNNRDLYFDRVGPLRGLLWKTPVLAFPWGIVFPLAVVGWVWALRDRRLGDGARFLGMWFALYAASLLPFFITARFRMGLLPAVLLLAGAALVRFRHWLRAPFVLLLFGAAILVNSGLAGVRTDNPAQELARRGEVYLRQNRDTEALRILERSFGMEPRITTALLLAEAYLRHDRSEEAIPLYLKVADARPRDPDVHFNLGVAYLNLQRYDDATNAFRMALRLHPGRAATWVNLGAALEGRGMHDRAESAYDKAIELAPGDEGAYLRLSSLYLDQDRLPDALSLLERGRDRIPGSYDLHYALAVAHARAGNRDQALEALQVALRLRPRDPRGLRLREWLQGSP
jgi:Flp pilus assembly protein TadD/4-amino-4-deoxy-L-arabinose transferase-like glycosyltransferase